MRALVAAGERAARSCACVGCGARGAGEGVALVGFMDVVEDGGGGEVVVREGAMVACVCAYLYILTSLPCVPRASKARCMFLSSVQSSRVESCRVRGIYALAACAGPLV